MDFKLRETLLISIDFLYDYHLITVLSRENTETHNMQEYLS